jgi:hypothetical protein
MRSATSKVYTVRIAFVTVFSLFPLVCLTADTVPGETGVAPSAADADFFERRIRPILVEHCIACHGPKKQESGLRLDTRQSIIKGGDTGSAANPGKPKKSLLLSAIRQTGDLKMPPEEPLRPEQIRHVERWIQRGLPWPEKSVIIAGRADVGAAAHWAFQPIANAPVRDGSRSSIDTHILHRLEEAGLKPGPRADTVTLIRRATLDLTGLPPTPEEVEAFQRESKSDPKGAFASQVDRLLDSPRYGERWGRYWLDVARYADNKGYVFFEDKNFPWAWTYRDWVIRAFNEDLPYDRFLLEQIAADQLDLDGDRRSLAALGFLTLGARFMNNTHDVIDDRIDVVTRGLMGLTVTCARCHDHKYDPIPQADYYSLYGVFRSSSEPILQPEFTAPSDTDEYRTFAAGMTERVTKLETFIETQRQQTMKGARDRATEYMLAVHRRRGHPNTENFMLLTDKGALIPAVIRRWEAYLKRTRRETHPVWTVWHRFFDLSDEEFAGAAARVHADLFKSTPPDDDSAPTINPLIADKFADQVPSTMNDVARLYGELFQSVDAQWQELLLQESASPPTRLEADAAEEIRQVLYGAGSPAAIPRQLGWGFLDLLPDRPTQGEFKKLIGEVEKWSKSQPGAPPRAMTLRDNESPYSPVVFLRGNPNREGTPVPRQFPQILAGSDRMPFTSGSGRLELARAIVDPTNPLTARVFVNRVWLHHFGRGLVNTPGDFGLRSSPPSHPRLLDELASALVKNGWSVKYLHRLIMNSSVYQQAAMPRTGTEPKQVDPENRLLSHFPRRRLDFEATRDSLLAVSGALDVTMGGPPPNVLNGFTPRRTVYGFVNRMDLPGLMRAFDFPEPAATSPQRETTTIAPQALFFLNHDFVSECARRLLRRPDVSELSEPPLRVARIYRIVFGRDPDPEEAAVARMFLQPRSESAASKAWTYGFGGVDEDTQKVTGFTRLTHWTGSRWQAGPKLPDPKLGWVFLDRNGGHPASSADRCAIRRWTAPDSGTIEIIGMLKHVPEPGNGVRGRIVHSRDGVVGEYRADHSESVIKLVKLAVEGGDTVDFVVDWQGQILHDEYEWSVVIRQTSPVSPEVQQVNEWQSQRDFTGDAQDHWLDFVHALLMANEFVFVD